MALVRQVSPLAPGRYWILVEGPDILDFDRWIRDMQGGVRVEATSLDARTRGQASQFVIFNVPEGRFPFLNAAQFGFPSVAGPEITSRDDVIQNDLQKNPEDSAADAVRKGAAAAESLAGLVPVVLVLLAAAALRR